jgi:hypothetical protein
MANASRSRRGTSPSFWRNYDGRQLMLARACMPSIGLSSNPQVNRTKAIKSALRSPAESRKVVVVKL